MSKHFYVDLHGCAKNQVDAELITHRLQDQGWVLVDDAEKANLIIVNTCGFIESAKKESLDAVISARENYPNAKILMAGCLSERYADVFKTDLPEVDGIFGNGDLSKIDDLVSKMEEGNRPVETYEQKGVCDGNRTNLFDFPRVSYIKITEGCDNYCSFCAIPLIRGRLRSRPIDAIVKEIKDLYKNGIFEFNLLGQDIAAFGSEHFTLEQQKSFDWNEIGKSPLASLLEKISELTGDFWVRLLYIHPDHFPRDILPIIKKDTRFLHYFDMPFQSGDDDIIVAMNRVGSKKIYETLVNDIRESLPDAAIRTTFLCGFPGENDESARNTEKFLKTIRPDWSGCFSYSREEGTASYDMKKRVPAKAAKERVENLQNIQSQITEEKLQAHVGKTYHVLVEELVDGESLALGRAWFQAPEVDGACVIRYDADIANIDKKIQPGFVIQVKLTGVRGVDVVGNYVET